MNLDELEEKKKRNQENRKEFVKIWAKYVKEHDDKEWSKQQNKIINSQLKSARETEL